MPSPPRFCLAAKAAKEDWVLAGGWGFRLMTVITLTAGTAFIMWLGEQITERGIGNGISLIIFAGIVAGLPGAIVNTFRLMGAGELHLFLVLILAAVMVAVVFFIVRVERAHRRIPVQYAKRVVGRKVYGGAGTYIPFKLNAANVVPIIFASAILFFPTQMMALWPNAPQWMQDAANALSVGWVHNVLYFALIIFFIALVIVAILGVFGNSVADLCRDVQDICNAAARALVNNMSIASGPQVVYNIDRLPQGENITQMYPWKVWQVTSDPLGAGLRGDLAKGLFFRGVGALPFGTDIVPVRALIERLLTPGVPLGTPPRALAAAV